MGSVVTGIGDMFSGGAEQQVLNAQKKIARANAVTAERNADWTMQAGESMLNQEQMKNRSRFGAIKARQAASGLDVNSGSAEQVQRSARELGQLDAMTIQSNAARAAFGYKEQARNFRDQAAVYKAEANAAPWEAGFKAVADIEAGAEKAILNF